MKVEIQHICLAEDDPDYYLLFSDILKKINTEIKLTWFQTCENLLDFLKTDSNLPCLIVLDMNMPKMDGHTCLVSIKRELELHLIPIIILSTAAYSGLKQIRTTIKGFADFCLITRTLNNFFK